MLIFYGLGNNETKYLQTKHNAGRLALEKLANKLDLTWQKQPSFIFTKTVFAQTPLYLLLSSGYMNTSGQPLASFVSYFKLDLSQATLIILHDDSDQSEGSVKLSQAGGSAGHKGVQSIYDHCLGLGLASESIWRLKIGIRPPMNKQRSETFVLSRFSESEKFGLNQLTENLFNSLPLFASDNFSKLQTDLNSKRFV